MHHHRRGGYGGGRMPGLFSTLISVLAVIIPLLWIVGTIEIWILDGGSLLDLLRSQWHYIISFFETHRIQ
jgi:hypothetical protein